MSAHYVRLRLLVTDPQLRMVAARHGERRPTLRTFRAWAYNVIENELEVLEGEQPRLPETEDDA